MLKAFSSFIFCLSTTGFANAQISKDTTFLQSVDNLLSEHFKPDEPGCVVLIAKKDQIIYKKAFGSADLELNVAMQPDMVFRLGSITKQYTAIAILQLVEKGKISLQDTSVSILLKDIQLISV